MEKFYVYQYVRLINAKHGLAGSPYYIGKGCGRRAWSKNHHTQPPNDPACIQFLAQDMNEADALQAEMLLIRLHGRIDKGTGCLQNRSDGGEFTTAFGGIICPMKGKKHSPEAREKMRLAKLGRKRGPNSAEWNAKIADGQRGKVVSEETRARMSAAIKGVKRAPRSAEHCEAIRRAKLGKNRPDMTSGSPTCLKQTASRIGKKRGPYRKEIGDRNEHAT